MGLRYDRDTNRRKNGPTIYFTDPTSLIMLTNEIRSALKNGLPTYVYKRPGDVTITFGTGSEVVVGTSTPGFVIAPFLPELPYLTIPYRDSTGGEESSMTFPFPEQSTTEVEHEEEITAIKQALAANGGGKIIAAREIVEEGRVDVPATFFELCRLHPDAFVFCFSTAQTGCWIGASPELLLEGRRGLLTTMALAGSRESGSAQPWDKKNIEEQQIVADYISETFARHNISMERDETVTRRAGKVEHLCTLFQGEAESPLSDSTLSALLHDLSPTPALCGLPRSTALKVIGEQEKNGRGCYGGFCGPYRSPSDFTFQVTLRCARVEKDRYCVYTGGGITLLSDAKEEWEETTLKASTILESLCVYPGKTDKTKPN